MPGVKLSDELWEHLVDKSRTGTWDDADYDAVVAGGGALLDAEIPWWWEPGVIDLGTLWMRHMRRCLLGQLFPQGTWLDGLAHLRMPEYNEGNWAGRHGFCSIIAPRGCSQLTRAWKRAIEVRRWQEALASNTLRGQLGVGLAVLSGQSPLRDEAAPGVCRLCECVALGRDDGLCGPCGAWADAGSPLPIPPQICNAVCPSSGFPETY